MITPIQHAKQQKQGFTPGPWVVHNNIGRKGEIGVVADAAPCVIACMGNAKAWPAEAECNARLIAAAPALFEALQAVVDHYVRLVNSGDAGNWNPETDEPIKQARAALLAATGKDTL